MSRPSEEEPLEAEEDGPEASTKLKNAIVEYSCAKRRFKQACDRSYARGCTNLGLLHQKGLKVRKNPRKALTLYERACRLGDGKACAWVGVLYQSDFATLPASQKKAESALRKGCSAGHAFACAALEVGE